MAALAGKLCAVALAAEPPPIVVAPNGSGDFKTVQAAIDSVPDDNADWQVIVIKPGTYKERLLIKPSKTFVILRGEENDAGRTIVTFDRYAAMDDPDAPGKKCGTLGSESVVILADNFIAENMTFENSAGRWRGPGVALRTMGDRQIFRNCRFLGWQDTLWVEGKRMYFRDSYVEGRVDVIFGRGTAVFENCHIHGTDGGCLTAANTTPETPFGLVFLKCKITCAEDRTFLGSPWGKGAATAFLECHLGDHLRPEGWADWRGTENHKSARFFEYRNSGPGSKLEKRPAWTRQLDDAEAKNYTVENILGGDDRWNPEASLTVGSARP